MHDPVPVGVLRSMGADILVASDLSVKRLSTYENARSLEQDDENNAARHKLRMPHIVDVLQRSFDMTMATIGMHSLRAADVAICPQVHSVSFHRFSEGHKFVTAGYDAAAKALPALRERLPWLAE
jgi:predicted acylesterase/phospholipase RssA